MSFASASRIISLQVRAMGVRVGSRLRNGNGGRQPVPRATGVKQWLTAIARQTSVSRHSDVTFTQRSRAFVKLGCCAAPAQGVRGQAGRVLRGAATELTSALPETTLPAGGGEGAGIFPENLVHRNGLGSSFCSLTTDGCQFQLRDISADRTARLAKWSGRRTGAQPVSAMRS
jgi:hypothetical protein